MASSETPAQYAQHVLQHYVDGAYTKNDVYQEALAFGATVNQVKNAIAIKRGELVAFVARLDSLSADIAERFG